MCIHTCTWIHTQAQQICTHALTHSTWNPHGKNAHTNTKRNTSIHINSSTQTYINTNIQTNKQTLTHRHTDTHTHKLEESGIGGGGGDLKRIDWCCFYYFVRNSLVALLEALRARIFSLDSWISFFFDIFFVCAKSLTKSFFRPSHPGSCAWLSPFLLRADSTCVLVCLCLCMCMWKCVGKVINI